MVAILSGFASICVNDDNLSGIAAELASKLPKSPRTEKCKELLMALSRSPDLAATLATKIRQVSDKFDENPFLDIESLSDLRIAESLAQSDDFAGNKMHILRRDPNANLRLEPLLDDFTGDDWRILVNRIDRDPDDLEGWQALEEVISRGDIADRVREYIDGYWVKYHSGIGVPDAVEECRARVMGFLGL
jgi:hypothetical protein